MNRETYLEQRNNLLNEMKKLIENNADAAEIEAKKTEIENLDAAYKTYAENMANFNALKDRAGAEAPFANIESSTGNNLQQKSDEEIYENAFAKHMLKQQLTDEETKIYNRFNNSTNTAAANTAVIPKKTVDGIWTEMKNNHPILKAVLPMHFKGNIDITIGAMGDTDNDWYDEPTSVDESGVTTATLSLTGCELIKTCVITWKLDSMAIEDFNPWLISELGDKMGGALAQAYFDGKGKPGVGESFKAQPTGVVTSIKAEASTPQKMTYDSDDGIAYTDITAMRALIKSGYKVTFYANNSTIWNQLANIKDLNGRPYFIADTTAGGVGRLFGVVVEEESVVPDGALLLADYGKGYKANISKDMIVKRFEKPYNIQYVNYMIVDGAPITTKAFAYLEANPSQV